MKNFAKMNFFLGLVFVLCLFNCVHGQVFNENKTLEQNLIESFHVAVAKSLTNATEKTTKFESAGYSHLVKPLLTHQIDRLKSYKNLIDTNFPLNQMSKYLNKNHIVHSLAIDLMHLEGEIGEEIQIIESIIQKDQQHLPLSNVNEHTLAAHVKSIIAKAKQSMLNDPNSREYPSIDYELEELLKLAKHLESSKLNQTELNHTRQIVDQFDMSMEVLSEKAKWRLPCHRNCHPTSNNTLLPITEPFIELHIVDLLQSHQRNYERKIKESEERVAKLTISGDAKLTSALVYQISQMKQFVDNVKAQLDEADQQFTVPYLLVLEEDNIRLGFRLDEENDILNYVLKFPSERNETHTQLVNRVRLLTRLGNDFLVKHQHAFEVPEVRDELKHLDLFAQNLADANTPKNNVTLNHQIEQQIDRFQKTLTQLMDWAINKF